MESIDAIRMASENAGYHWLIVREDDRVELRWRHDTLAEELDEAFSFSLREARDIAFELLALSFGRE